VFLAENAREEGVVRMVSPGRIRYTQHALNMRHLISAISVLAVLAAPFSVAARTPNDTFYGRQWYLPQMQAEQAWDVSTGSPSVIVAVVDTAMDIDHEDLKENIWTNVRENFGNGKDDDGNGFIDDIHGWNFLKASNEVRPAGGSSVDHGRVHATLVASLIAAKGNNDIGIAGVAWNVRIMPLVALDADGGGNTSDVANAIRYAVENGASIINLSLEGYTEAADVDEAIAYARSKGVLTVAAAGNADEADGFDLDEVQVYPVCLSVDTSYGLIGVGSTDRNDQHAPYANYGSCVNVSAPGDDIFGAIPTDPTTGAGYASGFSGTSLAVPLVSGAAALLKSIRPDWGWAEIRDRIMMTADSIDHLQSVQLEGKLGRGRLNLAAAVSGLVPVTSPALWAALATPARQPTRVLLTDGSATQEIAPFGTADMRGARAIMTDLEGDGTQEVVIASASGKTGDWAVYGVDGTLRRKGTVAKDVRGGLLIATVPGGFVLAEADGGRAWGIQASGTSTLFYPYGSAYHAGVEIVSIPAGVAFVPHGGGGHLAVFTVAGSRIASVFPFGKSARGRWSLTLQSDGLLRMIGSSGTTTIDPSRL
jgi:subtilisin family serine protease